MWKNITKTLKSNFEINWCKFNVQQWGSLLSKRAPVTFNVFFSCRCFSLLSIFSYIPQFNSSGKLLLCQHCVMHKSIYSNHSIFMLNGDQKPPRERWKPRGRICTPYHLRNFYYMLFIHPLTFPFDIGKVAAPETSGNSTCLRPHTAYFRIYHHVNNEPFINVNKNIYNMSSYVF